MGIPLSDLNDQQKSLIDAKDRKQFGKSAVTHSEARKAALYQAEKDLKRDVLQYLRVNGVRKPLTSPDGRKSRMAAGWPDVTFAWKKTPVVWELKIGANILQPDQIKAREELIADGWQHREVRCIFDCQQHLREIDAAVEGRVG